MGRISKLAAVCVTSCAWAAGAHAVPITFQSGSFTRTGIADTVKGGYDRLFVNASSGTLDLQEGIAQTAVINPFDFVVGDTGGSSFGLVVPFAMTRSLAVSGVAGSVSQTATVVIGASDSLTFAAGLLTSLDLGALGILDITPLALNTGAHPIGTYHGSLSASFLLHDVPAPTSVPEPASVLLLAAGAGAMLAARVRRRRRS